MAYLDRILLASGAAEALGGGGGGGADDEAGERVERTGPAESPADEPVTIEVEDQADETAEGEPEPTPGDEDLTAEEVATWRRELGRRGGQPEVGGQRLPAEPAPRTRPETNGHAVTPTIDAQTRQMIDEVRKVHGERNPELVELVEHQAKEAAKLRAQLARASQGQEEVARTQQQLQAAEMERARVQVFEAQDKLVGQDGKAMFGESFAKATPTQRQARELWLGDARDIYMKAHAQWRAGQRKEPMTDQRALELAKAIALGEVSKPEAVRQVQQSVRQAQRRTTIPPGTPGAARTQPAARDPMEGARSTIRQYLDARKQ